MYFDTPCVSTHILWGLLVFKLWANVSLVVLLPDIRMVLVAAMVITLLQMG